MGIFGKTGSGGVSFTSTPRAGAPRFPAGVSGKEGVWEPSGRPGLAARDTGPRGPLARPRTPGVPRGPGPVPGYPRSVQELQVRSLSLR